MEPMNLGSPVQSPVGHLGMQHASYGFQSPAPGTQPQFHSTMVGGVQHSQGMTPMGQSPVVAGSNMMQRDAGNPGFLPGYLIGSFPQQSASRGMISPTKLNRSISTNSQANTPATAAPKPNVNGGFLTPTTPVSQMRTPSEKPGPPLKGLYESTPGGRKKFGTPLSGTPRMLGGTPVNSSPALSFGATPAKDFDVTDSSFVSDGSVNTWVTIFGFPPHAASYILSQFSQCGTVLQHHIPPNGNWMNVRFQTKLQAQKALARSGRVFGGSLMVGVSPCTEPPSEAVNASHILEQTNNQDHSVLSLNSSLATHNRSIRPLTQSYKAAHNEHEVSAMANTPNKNNGFVGKAMEYIFGW